MSTESSSSTVTIGVRMPGDLATALQNEPVQRQERKRLSLVDCRKRLPPKCALSDAEVLLLRDQMYSLAERVVSLATDRSTQGLMHEQAATQKALAKHLRRHQ